MTKTQVQTNIDGALATITFVTEEGLNVLSTDGLYALGAAIAKVRKDPLVRTTVLQAKGKVFVAGADIKEMAAFKPDQAHEYATLGQSVMNDLASLPSITVAAIQGGGTGRRTRSCAGVRFPGCREVRQAWIARGNFGADSGLGRRRAINAAHRFGSRETHVPER